MKSTFIERVDNVVKFSVEFTADEFENAQIEVYKNNKGKFAVAGFRKGKAPRRLIETHYGADIFFEDAINDLVADAYPAALDELGIEPVDRPDMDFSEIAKGKGFTLTAAVAVPPEVTPADYKGVVIEPAEHAVSEEDVDREIEVLRSRNARLVVADRPAENGDTVFIDYAGFVDGLQFDGGTAERQSLKLGSGNFIPGFEEQLLGLCSGEERDVKVSFPEDYHAEDLAGKEAVFHCKLHEIKVEEKPEINDEFAQDASEFDTLDALRADIRAKLEDAALSRSELEMKNAVLEKIYLANEIELPDVMVESQMDELVEEFAQQLRYQGLSPEQYYAYAGKDAAAFREGLRADAFKKVKTRLLVRAVADAEGIEASEDEVEKEIAAMADMYRTEPEKLRESMGRAGVKMVGDDVRNRKTVDFLFANAVIEPARDEQPVTA
ncbi:MAG: trigger factor [Clostridiales Family XIII bacterium]|jgi:trigger factor|nr:trigger factor [Clostridiales Family XIII bacterium]